MPDCKNCSNKDWKNHYMMAQKRFDKQIAKLVIVSTVSFAIAVMCLIVTIIVICKFQMFISEFEYVEETEVEISQDLCGENTAIIGDGNEVISYGAKNNN